MYRMDIEECAHTCGIKKKSDTINRVVSNCEFICIPNKQKASSVNIAEEAKTSDENDCYYMYYITFCLHKTYNF